MFRLGELYLKYTMPKGKKKKSATLNTPYSVSKKSCDNQEQDKEDILLCDSCKLQVDQVIQCEYCELWFCSTCESIPVYVVDIITAHKQIHWFCKGCDAKALDSLRSHGESTQVCGGALQEKIVSAVVEQFKNVIHETKECVKKTIDETLKQAPMNNVNNMELDSPHLSSNGTTSDVISTFLNEEKERSKRCCNVIVHNLEESTLENSQQRKEYDISTISSVFTKHLGVKASITNAIRIGKKQDSENGSSPRLVKVTVASEQEKALLLRNCTKLCDKNNPEEVKNIYVTPDLTPKEQKESKALRSKLAEMNRDGKKFWIKNGKIVQRGN